MSFAATAALGAVSGLTIMLGLPIARWGRPGPRLMSFLTMASVGVLLFIFYDVIRNASETVEAQVSLSAAGGALFGLLLAAVSVVQEDGLATAQGGDGRLDGLHRAPNRRGHIKNELRAVIE